MKQKTFMQKCYEKLAMLISASVDTDSIQYLESKLVFTVVKHKVTNDYAMALSVIEDDVSASEFNANNHQVIPIALMLTQNDIGDYYPEWEDSQLVHEITREAFPKETRGKDINEWHLNHEVLDEFFDKMTEKLPKHLQ